MNNSFFKKTLRKHNIVFTAAIVCLGFLFFFAILFYYKNKVALAAAQQEGAANQVQCGTQIPIGETLDRSGEFITDLVSNLRTMQGYIPYEIKAVQQVLGLADQCDVSVCQTQNCGSHDCSWTGPPPLYTYHPATCCNTPNPSCTSQWQWQGQYLACPQADIEATSTQVTQIFGIINTAGNNIKTLIEGANEEVCAQENADIRTPLEQVVCNSVLCNANPGTLGCPKITKLEVISRKLDKARQGFDGCTITPTEWSQIQTGQNVATKSVLDCRTVIQKGYQRQQPDCRCAPQNPSVPSECGGFQKKSLLNYYCCR